MKQEIINDLISWVDSNLDKRLTLDEVAERSGFSKWYLQHCFKANTGEPLAGYVRRSKLERAANALASSEKNVLAIAVDYGFDSYGTFARAFRNHFNVTPTAYRSALSQGGE